jgi:hypothetical protein
LQTLTKLFHDSYTNHPLYTHPAESNVMNTEGMNHMSTPTNTRLSTPNLLKSGSAAVLAAVIANIIARFLLAALVPLSPGFPPLSLGPIITFTVIFTVIGVGVFALVNRLSAHPLKLYNILGIVAFFVSILPNLAAQANPAARPMGGNGPEYLTLIFFHVVAAIVFLSVLNFFARKA